MADTRRLAAALVAPDAIGDGGDDALVFKLLAVGRGETAKILVPLARAGQRGVADSNLQWHDTVHMKKAGKPFGRPALQLYVKSWRPSDDWRPRWCATGS